MAIDPTAEQLGALADSADEGAVLMLNLLRFKEEADGGDAGMSGVAAYRRYSEAVLPLLARVGAEVRLAASPEETVIGPPEPGWDMVLVVEYPSRAAFLEMIGDPDYQRIHAHRAGALADSRLIACAPLGT